MSMQKAMNVLLERLGQGEGTQLCAMILTLGEPWAKADATDALGRSVLLIGKAALGSGPDAEETVRIVSEQLAAGRCHEAVHPVVFAPQASAAIRAVLDGPQSEFLLHGPRGTGKTIVELACVMAMAEFHHRGGFEMPYKALWLHDTLLSAAAKTAESMREAMWNGMWTLHDGEREGRLKIGGCLLVEANFVATLDETAEQRIRALADMILAEELVSSLTDGTGIAKDKYELALSSQANRRPTWRRVAVSSTNPGGPETWPALRFGITGPGHPNARALQISRNDRLTPEQQAALDASFTEGSALQRRLARGEWVMAIQGAAVAEGFDESVHVSRRPMKPRHDLLLGIGWDGGHTASAVIGQSHQGACEVYAGLNPYVGVNPGDHDKLRMGTQELIEQQVRPWLQEHAPWALSNYGAQLVHIIDPNMATPGQATTSESSEKMIVKMLGGRIVRGPVRWAPRREAVLKTLAPRHERGRIPLVIAECAETLLLIRALNGAWYYKKDPDGQINRTGPEKPNSPYADLGDALAYLLGWLMGGDFMDVQPREVKVESSFEIGGSMRAPQVVSSW